MSKKNKNAAQGTYALCITAGTVIGFGLGALLGNVLVPLLLGAAVGWGAGFYFNSRTAKKKH